MLLVLFFIPCIVCIRVIRGNYNPNATTQHEASPKQTTEAADDKKRRSTVTLNVPDPAKPQAKQGHKPLGVFKRTR